MKYTYHTFLEVLRGQIRWLEVAMIYDQVRWNSNIMFVGTPTSCSLELQHHMVMLNSKHGSSRCSNISFVPPTASSIVVNMIDTAHLLTSPQMRCECHWPSICRPLFVSRNRGIPKYDYVRSFLAILCHELSNLSLHPSYSRQGLPLSLWIVCSIVGRRCSGSHFPSGSALLTKSLARI